MPNESSPLTTLELPIVLDAASRSFMKKAFALACCAEAAPDLVTDKPVFAIDPESVSRLVEALEPTLLAAGLLREYEPPTGSDWASALAHLTQEPIIGFSVRGGRQGKPSARVTPAGTDTAKAAKSVPAAGSSGRAGIACGSAGG